MHQFAAGQDTQRSCPVGITTFGLGVTDQPRTEALAGTEAPAGTEAAPARTTATSGTDIFAAIPRLIQSFMVTPMLQSQFAGPLGHALQAARRKTACGKAQSGTFQKGFNGCFSPGEDQNGLIRR
jgi:hypothetical protein